MMIVVLGKAPGQGKKPLALEQFFEGWGSSEQYFWSCVFSQSVWWSIRQKTYEGNKEKTYEGDEEKTFEGDEEKNLEDKDKTHEEDEKTLTKKRSSCAVDLHGIIALLQSWVESEPEEAGHDHDHHIIRGNKHSSLDVLNSNLHNIHYIHNMDITGCFFHWYPPKKLKYGKPRLGESTLT